MRADWIPRVWQPPAIDHILRNPRCAVWADPGLGKTVMSLTALHRLRMIGEGGPALVLAPKRVARDVWPYESPKWRHLWHMRIVPILGTAEQRRKAIRTPADLHTINYENVPWLIQEMRAAGTWPWPIVFADESTRLKGHDAKRVKGTPTQKDPETGELIEARMGLMHILPYTKRWVNLTGTPAPNGLMDLWAQTYMLDQGTRLGNTITAFRNRWFILGIDRKWHPGEYADRDIKAKLRGICLTLEARDYLDLPPLQINDIWVNLDKDTMAQYKKLEREFFLKLERGEVTAANSAVKSGKLLQCSNGALYLDPEDYPGVRLRKGAREWEVVHNEKLDALADLLEELAGVPLLVTYQFKSDLARLQECFPFAKMLKTKADENDWNAGKIPMLLVHPSSCGHGLDLQHGSNHIAMFSMTWDLEQYIQVIERLGPVRQYQAGYNRPVFLHRLLARGTIDHLAIERIGSKASVQDSLKEFMKRVL